MNDGELSLEKREPNGVLLTLVQLVCDEKVESKLDLITQSSIIRAP